MQKVPQGYGCQGGWCPVIVVLEGIDKAGKGTQSARLQLALRAAGVRTALFSFPTDGLPTGRAFDSYVRGLAGGGGLKSPEYDPRVVPLLAAADMWAAAGLMRGQMRRNDVVICNRSPASNKAYGAAAGLDRHWLDSLTRGHPAANPDACILLDISAGESFRRCPPEERDAFESDRRFLQSVRAAYLSEAEKHGWAVVRADRPADDVHRAVMRMVMPRISRTLRLHNGSETRSRTADLRL